jgi:hypothetical protein
MRPRGSAEAVRDVPAIEHDYYSDLTLQAVAHKHGMSIRKLYRMRDKLGWPKRRDGPHEVDRLQIINRMFRLLERQIITVEATMKDVTDKEVAVLGNLVRTLEKLIDIEKAQAPKVTTKAHSEDMHDIRKQLEKRINDLTKS